MKNHLFTAAIFVSFLINGQEKSSKFSVDIRTKYLVGIGNGYFKDSFNVLPGFALGVQYKIISKFGIFVNLSENTLSIKNSEIYGDFNKVIFINTNIGGFYSYVFNNKAEINAKGFIGNFYLQGNKEGFESKYIQKGIVWGVGSDFAYKIDKKGHFDIVCGIEYLYLDDKIEINNSYYQKYYSYSSVLRPSLGLKINF